MRTDTGGKEAREQRGPLSLSHHPVSLWCFNWQLRSAGPPYVGSAAHPSPTSNPNRRSSGGEGDGDIKEWEEERTGTDVGA